SLLFLFFFFQAEDGIRVATVTGVQTCALPILFFCSAACLLSQQCSVHGTNGHRWADERHNQYSFEDRPSGFRRVSGTERKPAGRSEERRVGKECGGGRLRGIDKANDST